MPPAPSVCVSPTGELSISGYAILRSMNQAPGTGSRRSIFTFDREGEPS
jgi:hypothetical protein